MCSKFVLHNLEISHFLCISNRRIKINICYKPQTNSWYFSVQKDHLIIYSYLLFSSTESWGKFLHYQNSVVVNSTQILHAEDLYMVFFKRMCYPLSFPDQSKCYQYRPYLISSRVRHISAIIADKLKVRNLMFLAM